MQVRIPEELKADVPQTTWGKILAATPVAMAVVATMLAGLASSEMTRAQYDRALAAQQQSKAGDQWSFFQAKRLRGAVQRNTVDLLQATTQVRPLDPAALKASVKSPEVQKLLDSPAGQQAIGYLRDGKVPPIAPGPAQDPNIKAASAAVEEMKPDPEVRAILAQLSNATLDKALHDARDQTQDFDATTKPINQTIDQVAAEFESQPGQSSVAATADSPLRDFTVARLRFAAQRYEVEARLNQSIANLYELQVRKSNISAERHHGRSQLFFIGMLGAQLGVIISTFAMAAKKRNLLWSLAAGAGIIAIVFAVYVYLWF